MDARLAARGLSPVADDGRAEMGSSQLSADRLSGASITSPRRRPGRRRSRWTRLIQSCCALTLSSAFRWSSRRSLRGSRDRRWRSTPCSTPFRSRPRSKRSSPRRGSFSARFPRRSAIIPISCAAISARSCRAPTTSTRRSIRRCSPTARLSMCRRACAVPMELSTYFRINEKNTGQFERTLIIADKGLRQLSRRLHRAQARRKPASRRSRRTHRAGRRRDQIFDGAELVSGRLRGSRRHL